MKITISKLIIITLFWLIPISTYCQKDIEIYFFLEPECPISQQYTNFIQSLYFNENKAKDISSIKLIFPSKPKKGFSKQVEEFMKKYKLNIPFQIDWNYMLARKLKATATPEVFLVVGGVVKYHGAIDNMYAKLGVKRQEITEFYLIDAINATRNGLQLIQSFRKPLGCLIEY